MQEFVSLVVLLVVLSCGLSIMLSPLTGRKMDPFLLARPFGQYAKKVSKRGLTGALKTCKKWTRSSWRAAQNPRQHILLRLLLYGLATVCGIGVAILAIPADIFSSGKK